jgi:hypothetical protein
MARTVIDIDDDNEDAVKHRKRASFLNWLAEGGLPDLRARGDADRLAGHHVTDRYLSEATSPRRHRRLPKPGRGHRQSSRSSSAGATGRPCPSPT